MDDKVNANLGEANDVKSYQGEDEEGMDNDMNPKQGEDEALSPKKGDRNDLLTSMS